MELLCYKELETLSSSLILLSFKNYFVFLHFIDMHVPHCILYSIASYISSNCVFLSVGFLIYAFPEFISSCSGDIYVFCVLVVTFIISINLSSVMVYLDFVCCSLFFVIDVS